MIHKIKKGLDRTLEFLVALVMGILVLDVTWQVFTRFVLRHPSSWTEELATFLMIWVALLGAGVALNRKAHLGVDYFVGKLPPDKKLYTEIFAFSACALFSLLVLVIGGIRLVAVTLIREQISPALHLKMGYVYLALPISGLFLILYSLEFLFESIKSLRNLKQASGDSS
jgi:TRAP-type C4-dicarboxylate transport system permease small subunit